MGLQYISRKNAICVLLFMLICTIGIYWTHISQKITLQEKHLFVSEVANAQANAIERRLQRSLSATRFLALEIKQQNGSIADFESFADEILSSIGGISNLQLAPGGVIQRIHPLQGNEKAIGHNILKDDKRQAEAHSAIQERRLTLAGPFELIQGGVAVIGRNPVFVKQDGKEVFWGFTSALIFLEDLLAESELDDLESRGYRYCLERIHPDTGELQTIAKSENPIIAPSHSAQLQVPGSSWKLTISHPQGSSSTSLYIGYAISFAVALFISLATGTVLTQPDKLRRLVKRKTKELETLAFRDALTGLSNRRLLGEHLGQIIKQTQRKGETAALIYLDLDDFKRVNDLLGHEAGDQVLQQISQRITSTLRKSDLVARLGGDEFAVLLMNPVSISNVSRVAKSLITVIEQPVILSNKEFLISASMGITMVPTDGDDVTSLLRNADMAMYEAKNNGGKQHCFFDKSMQDKALAKIRLDEQLAVAVSHNQFVLHYQPIYDLETRTIESYEALIRWNHPEQGLTFPDKFIAQAEESGCIKDIGYLVIQAACLFIKENLERTGYSPYVSINLSPQQFMDPELAGHIQRELEKCNLNACYLQIEITESSLMENIDTAIAILHQLKAMGIKIAIDDFGTGYSSLAMLRRLPADKLKIDRSFVMEMDDNRSDQRIVRGLIYMAHTLQLKVVAEGIETETQEDILRRYGCDLGQGYFFSRPLPVSQLDIPSGIHQEVTAD